MLMEGFYNSKVSFKYLTVFGFNGFKLYLLTEIIYRCVNSWCTKKHGTCKSRITLGFTEEINQLIVQHPQSEKRGRNVYKLEQLDHEVLFKNHNYTIVCKKCSPSKVCSRHIHIPFCYDLGPKPNGRSVTKNGPFRASQRALYGHMPINIVIPK